LSLPHTCGKRGRRVDLIND
jgi:hypothetical protein